MMKKKIVRDWVFNIHRYLGLAVGLILIIVGLTGSILVFHEEIDHFLMNQQFGEIVPQGEMVSPISVIETIKKTNSSPDYQFESLRLPSDATSPYLAWMNVQKTWTQVLVHPYTGKILAERPWEASLFGVIYKLHYALAMGDVGIKIVGIAALLLFILSITGIVLWPGWRKLIAGFKIKWKAHPKRVNFDIHKVAGIITAVFLALIAFTGFCWNFYDVSEPIIYAITFTPKIEEPVSRPLPGKTPLGLAELFAKSNTIFPEATTVRITPPKSPEATFQVRKRFPEEREDFGMSEVILDQYTGEVLKLQDSRSLSRAESVLYSFTPLHYGTFGGFPTRVLYVFVGLSPTILMITGTIMWWYRRRIKKNLEISKSPSLR